MGNDEQRRDEEEIRFPWGEPRQEWVGTITEEDRAAFSDLADRVRPVRNHTSERTDTKDQPREGAGCDAPKQQRRVADQRSRA
jgi:hypothetical protein